MTNTALLTGQLRARTVALAPGSEVDLLQVAGADGYLLERDGVGLAGRGVAAHIDVPSGLAGGQAGQVVAEALARIERDDPLGWPGCGPVAMAALPFDRHRATSLVVPKLVVGRSADGATWMTTIGPADAAGPDVAPLVDLAGGAAAEGPDSFRLTPSMSHEQWCELVATTVERIQRGSFAKVVLARQVLVEANRTIDITAVLGRLRALYPSCLVFSMGGFVGASPELLIRRRGDQVWSHPLAGTIPRSGDPAVDEELAAALMASVKDRSEHGFVIDDVTAVLRPVCEELTVPERPSILPLRNVSHLGTRIHGRLRPGGPGALDLAALLHPTPAVGGTPRQPALRWLADHEGFDRGPYAGPVGWVDSRGDGEWMVAIRSALIDGHRARLFAGVGVVADSDPADELAETQLKLQALLSAVVRP
jgi:menaquinone-specific isochorismate synthase